MESRIVVREKRMVVDRNVGQRTVAAMESRMVVREQGEVFLSEDDTTDLAAMESRMVVREKSCPILAGLTGANVQRIERCPDGVP